MQRFKFKLDALLKLRQFKEKKIETELGEIVKKIEILKLEINKHNQDIDLGYKTEEELLKGSADGRTISFFPSFFSGKRAAIKVCKLKINALEDAYEKKIEELKVAKGEVKVVDQMKENSLARFKKEYDRYEQNIQDEFVMMRLKKDYR